MARIILRANIASGNFSVEHKVLETPIAEEVVELLITPKNGLSIKASDFNTGYLPREISSIEYVDLGSNVIAKVHLAKDIKTDVDLNIALPISGMTTSKSDNFTLISNSSISGDVITSDSSSYGKSTNGNSTTYSISNGGNKKILLLSKNFIAPVGYYFPTNPTYSISGNISRYKIVSKTKKNKDGNITSNTIEVYYTSPKEIKNIGGVDTISFTANLSEITKPKKKQLQEFIATEKKDYKIYSVDTGRDVGLIGGVKRVIVKGVPGTPFKVLVSNTSNEMYNFTNGRFEDSGGMLSGVIPAPVNGASFGVSNLSVIVPPGTVANTIKTQFMSSEEIDHSLIVGGDYGPNITKENVIAPTTSMTFTLTSSGFDLPQTGDLPNTDYIIGPGSYKTLDGETYYITVTGIVGSSAERIQIVRQPRHSNTSAYVNWDSGDATKEVDSAGTAINNDWSNVTDNKEWNYSISTKCTGVGERDGDGYFAEVKLKVTISGITYGKEDINPQLDLLNFLTLHG